jgi:hypothetical protein
MRGVLRRTPLSWLKSQGRTPRALRGSESCLPWPKGQGCARRPLLRSPVGESDA